MSPHRTDSMDEIMSLNGTHPAPNGVAGPEQHTSSAPAVQALESINGDCAPELVDGPILADTRPTTNVMNGVNGSTSQGAGRLCIRKSQYIKPSDPDATYDLVCIGFGPASVAIAVALHDALEAGNLDVAPKVLFLEKQAQFAWHAGMLLPGAKMQISFIKDLASLRDPRSHFTFLNYLHKNDRLIDFTNLSTFLPARSEFEDYLRWCASHFDDVVKYNNEVVSVSPVQEETGPSRIFVVTSRNVKAGATTSYKSRNVILAVGGQPAMPKIFPSYHPRVIHSSQYAQRVPQLLADRSAPYHIAVIGAGQSAAEIFDNVQNLYPNSKTLMIMRSEFLKPSDDSPFVNSIFNPEFVTHIYNKSSTYRRNLLDDAKATNYSVVRLELIEHLYEKMYHQKRLLGDDEKNWPHRIVAGTQLVEVQEIGDRLRIKVAPLAARVELQDGTLDEEVFDVDLVICATGYQRTAHVDILRELAPLLPVLNSTNGEIPVTSKERWLVDSENMVKSTGPRVLEVGRNYGVRFSSGAVAPGSGVWLQGCCEATHGLSDTLLSVLSTRSGEMVESIFGAAA